MDQYFLWQGATALNSKNTMDHHFLWQSATVSEEKTSVSLRAVSSSAVQNAINIQNHLCTALPMV